MEVKRGLWYTNFSGTLAATLVLSSNVQYNLYFVREIEREVIEVDYLRQTIGSAELSGLFNLPPTLRNKKVEVIVLPVENEAEKESTHEGKRGYKLNMGFLPGPELPDSFFEPLPEEDLQAWGL